MSTYSSTEEPEQRYRPEREKIPGNLSSLRQKLHRKAKQEPEFKFYSLYGHVIRRETLETAYELVKANGGSPGVDGVTFEDIQERPGGEEGFIEEIQQKLKDKQYEADPVLRVYIEKKGGGERPLGIPTIEDRTVQMAVLLVLEPIFEERFHESSYGFRPKRSAHQALEKVRQHIEEGYDAVLDADLKSCFDKIPHDNLMKAIEDRVTDGSVLSLIRKWLKAPIVEKDDDQGERGERSGEGTPQGGVISPLLANIYLHWFDYAFHLESGPAGFANAKLVRYADDFLVMARYQGKRLREAVKYLIEERLELKLNQEKTEVVDLKKEGARLNFLGYTYSKRRGRVRMEPSKEAINSERRKLKKELRNIVFLEEKIEYLNRHLVGWGRYFSKGKCSRALEKINWYVRERIRRSLSRMSQRPFKTPEGTSMYQFLQEIGLIRLSKARL